MRNLGGSLIIVLVLLCGGLPGAALDAYPSVGAGGPTDLRAYVRGINVLTGVDRLDLLLDDVVVWRALGAGASTAHLPVQSAGRYVVAIRSAAAPGGTLPRALAEVRLYPQFYYTLLVYGPADAPAILLLADEPRRPAAGQYRLRVVHALRGGPPLTLLQAGVPVAPALPYGAVTPDLLLPRPDPVTIRGPAGDMGTVPLPATATRDALLIIYGAGTAGVPVRGLVVPFTAVD
jgi:hypothetical protein